MATTTSLKLLADYHQFLIFDPKFGGVEVPLWDREAVASCIVVNPHQVSFGTGRNMTIPVDVIVHVAAPETEALLGDAEHAVQAGLICETGSLNVEGCTGDVGGPFVLPIRAGCVGVLYLSFALSTIEPVYRLEGDDRYELHVWPSASVPETHVFRRAPTH